MKKRSKSENGDLDSFFGKGVSLKGILKAKGTIRFDGEMEGEITSDTLILGEGGIINADIKTGTFINMGMIKGNVSALEKVTLHEKSRLEGNIETSNLIIEEGARFQGNSKMYDTGVVEKEKKVIKVIPQKIRWERQRVAAIIVVIALTISSFLFFGLSGSKRLNGLFTANPVRYVDSGFQYLEEGKLDYSLSEFTKAIEMDDSNVRGYLGLGEVLKRKGLEYKAIKVYKKVVELKPDSVEGHLDLGEIYVEKGLDDKAMVEFEKVVELDTSNLEGHLGLGGILKRRGEGDKAILEYEKVVELKPDSVEGHLDLGEIYVEKGLDDKAMVEFEKVVGLDTSNLEGHLGLGGILKRRGEGDKAILEYEKVVELKPDS
ncbi:MAG: tetratricopeptide repeat protein, partial [Nitrospinae bacterium]|nr:tetratricopeptide repeat protein [Nitrospinota bacterium]